MTQVITLVPKPGGYRWQTQAQCKHYWQAIAIAERMRKQHPELDIRVQPRNPKE